MAIGVFWTRLGSPTGASESGATEEIDWFIKNSKPVMIYFSSKPIEPAKLDINQYSALKDFEKGMQKIGLTGSYSSTSDLREQLLNQISINIRALASGEVLQIQDPQAAKEKATAIRKMAKSGKVYMEDYEKDGEVRCFIVKGDAKPLKDDIKSLGGRWNKALGGWVSPKSKEIEIAEFIKKNV